MKRQHLRFFVAAVDCGGVVKAAERLRVSQPAASAGLKARARTRQTALLTRVTRARYFSERWSSAVQND
jgi:DNA-binding transcriptional LysR family regulator